MGVSERMWAEISNCWRDCSENEWYWVTNEWKQVGIGGSGWEWVGVDVLYVRRGTYFVIYEK